MSVAERGTPKTLRDALRNGVDEFDEQEFESDEDIKKEDLVETVYNHVTDFLAQKLMAAAIQADMSKNGYREKELHALFKRITK